MLPPTQVLWECLFRCYEDETFLLPLAASFFKLSLQLLSRYTNWIRAGVTRLQLTSGTQGAASADQATSSSSNSAASSSSSTTTATSTTSTAASAASAIPTKTASQEQSSDVSWADWLAADQYVLLVFDLEKLLSDVRMMADRNQARQRQPSTQQPDVVCVRVCCSSRRCTRIGCLRC